MDSPDDPTEDVTLPCAQALVAGTVALMTVWADPCPDGTADLATQRLLVARKIVSNLYFLRQHPHLGEPLRQVMANAHQRWVGVARAAEQGGVLPASTGSVPVALH